MWWRVLQEAKRVVAKFEVIQRLAKANQKGLSSFMGSDTFQMIKDAELPASGAPPSSAENRGGSMRGERYGTRESGMRVGVLHGLASSAEAIVVLAIVINIFITFINAAVRYLFNQDFPMAADVWTILISIITFLGAPAYFRRTPGMAYTALIDASTARRREALSACGLSIFLGVCLTALAAYPSFFGGQMSQLLPILKISSGFVGIWLGIGLVLIFMLVYYRGSGINADLALILNLIVLLGLRSRLEWPSRRSGCGGHMLEGWLRPIHSFSFCWR